MDEDAAVARAEALRVAGERAEATQSLRTRVERNAAELRARRLLAEWYRDAGTHDQAGRWGIVFPGWTTTYERERVARLFAASRGADAKLPGFLHLPEGRMPPEAEALLPRIAEHRARLALKGILPEEEEPTVHDGRLGGVAVALGFAAFAAVLLIVVVTCIGVLLGNPMTPFARWAFLGVVVVAVVAAVLGLVHGMRTSSVVRTAGDGDPPARADPQAAADDGAR